jgi:hypothetical protein
MIWVMSTQAVPFLTPEQYLEIERAAGNRQSDGSWPMREYSAPSDEIALDSTGCRLRLADVYERVEFEAAS